MKRIVWLGAAALIALAAAVPLWLVLDGGGDRRAAALTEQGGLGQARLTIPGVNDGKPFNVERFSWGAERQANGVKVHDLDFTRAVTEISPQLFDVTAPSAELALYTPDLYGNTVVSLIYTFNEVAIHAYQDGGEYVTAPGTGAAFRSRGRTSARMTFASVSERFSFTPQPQADHGIGRMTVSAAEGKGVVIRAYQFDFGKSTGGADKLMVTREIDRLAPWFSEAVTRGTPRTDVTLELIGPNLDSGATETYATYNLTDVTVESVRDFDSGVIQEPILQEVVLSYGSARMTSGGASATLAPSR